MKPRSRLCASSSRTRPICLASARTSIARSGSVVTSLRMVATTGKPRHSAQRRQGSLAGVEPPAAERPAAGRSDLALGDEIRAFCLEVEHLRHALVSGLVDDLIRRGDEHFVEEPGGMKRIQDLRAPLAREVADSSFGEQTLVRTSEARRL